MFDAKIKKRFKELLHNLMYMKVDIMLILTTMQVIMHDCQCQKIKEIKKMSNSSRATIIRILIKKQCKTSTESQLRAEVLLSAKKYGM